MKKDNNFLGTLIILLSMVVLGYTAFIIYDKVIRKDEKPIITVERRTTNVVGEYTAEFKDVKYQIEDQDVYYVGKLTLDLYDNGIFHYVYGDSRVPRGIIGNYIVKDKTIVLTAWFTTGSSPQLGAAKRVKVLKINDDGSLMDNDIRIDDLVNNLITTTELIKTGDINEDYNISERLNVSCIINYEEKCIVASDETKF